MKTDVALEELIRTYDREIVRKNSLESKASAHINTSAIVISILNGFIAFVVSKLVTFNNSVILIIINIIATILIGISIYYSLDILNIKKVLTPLNEDDPDELLKNFDEDEKTMREKLKFNYSASISQIKNINDIKASSLTKSSEFLIVGIFLSFIGLIITLCINGG